MHFLHGFLFVKNKWDHHMQITVIRNPDMSGTTNMAYKIARVVYAQTGGVSLPLVCAFTSMIKNLSDASGVAISNLISDKTIFPALKGSDINHVRLHVPAQNRAFQMCVRTAYRTYIISATGILSAIGAYLVGDTDLFTMLQAIFTLAGIYFLRRSNETKGKK
jgi:hypothetical protein